MSNNGFRVQPQASKKDKLRELETYVSNLTAASRITQAMIQQLLQNNKNMGEDLNKTMGMLNELQYKILAMQKLSPVSALKVAEEVELLKLNDFNEASDKEDAQKGYTVLDTVEDSSNIVILTSTTSSVPDKGIFRSKITLSEAGVPDLVSGLVGKPVGTKVSVKLNGEEHLVELLGVRKPPAAAEPASSELSQ
jgi:hypothetical protein